MATGIQNRMATFLERIGLTAEQFEKQVGLGGGFVSRLSGNVRKSSLLKITLCYPNLNTNWLLSGIGEMFHETKDIVPFTGVTQRDRLRAFAEYGNMSEATFCKKAGLSPSFITKLTNNMRESSAMKIRNAFPLLNMDWVKNGEGKMLLKDTPVRVDMSIVDRINKIIEFIGIPRASFEQQVGLSRGYVKYADNVSQITISKICERYPFINDRWLAWGEGEMCGRTFHSVPLFDLLKEKNIERRLADNTGMAKLKHVPCLDKEITVAFKNLQGADNISVSDIVLCRPVEISKANIPFIVTSDKGVTCNSSAEEGHAFQICEIIRHI